MVLSREEILAKMPALRQEECPLPELEGSVFVREMSSGERDKFEYMLAKGERSNFRALLASFTVCDESGARLFTEADAAALGTHSAAVLDRIATTAIKLNKFSGADVAALSSAPSGPGAAPEGP